MNKYITIKELSQKCDVSIFFITNLLGRHEYSRTPDLTRKTILKTELNKKRLIKDLNLYSYNTHYTTKFRSKITKAIETLKREKWDD